MSIHVVPNPPQFDVAVVSATGAAGLVAAIFAAGGPKASSETWRDRASRIIVFERTRDGGRKILISGGGRCNVLPIALDESRFVTDSSPNLLRKMLRAWPLAEQVRFFEDDLGIPLVEEHESGKRFPASHKARDVRDGLVRHARAQGVDIRFDTRVHEPRCGRWRVAGWRGGRPRLAADRVIVATGGLSVPTTGSDGTGLRLLETLGHVMHPTYAALTPLTADAPTTCRTQRRVAHGHADGAPPGARNAPRPAASSSPTADTADHRCSTCRTSPCARAWKRPPARVTARWTPLGEAEWEAALRPQGARTVQGALRGEMPERLAQVLMDMAGVDPATSLAALRRDDRVGSSRRWCAVELPWSGDEGYRKAEVTGGGVAPRRGGPADDGSRRAPGLYLCGEVLDAFGPIGGYNFCWAWATGRLARNWGRAVC